MPTSYIQYTNKLLPLFTLQADLGSTDMALALNRYLCTSVLPLLTKCSTLLCALEDHVLLVDSLIQAIYSLSRALSLTKAQRDTIEDCLLALSRWVFKFVLSWKNCHCLHDIDFSDLVGLWLSSACVFKMK